LKAFIPSFNSIQSRVWGLGGSIGLWLVFVMIYLLFMQFEIRHTQHEHLDHYENAIHEIFELKTLFEESSLDIAYLVLTGDTGYAKNFKLHTQQFPRFIDDLHKHADNVDDKAFTLLVTDINDSIQQYLKQNHFLLENYDSTISTEVLRQQFQPRLVNTIRPIIDKLDVVLEQAMDVLGNKIYDDKQRIDASIQYTINMIMLFLIMGCVIGAVGMYLIRRLFFVPLNNTVLAMNMISNKGDLSHQLEVKDNTEFDHMATAFNDFVGKIKQVIDLVMSSSENLIEESEKLSALTGESHTQTQIQKQQIDESVLSLRDMSSMLDGNAQHTRSAAEAAQQAYSDAESSRRIVQSMLSSSRQAAEQVDNAVNEVNELEGLSDNIGDILNVIKGITEQTGLLSLNAAIEAARAGDAGRGFAVVADEVRSMSYKVQEQTEHIKAQIEKLQAAVKQVVNAMSVVREKSQDSVAHASTAGEALDSITRSTESIMELNQQIARDTELENESAIKVSANLEGIGLIAQETADASKAASELGREFTFLSRQLSGLINQILLNADDVSSKTSEQQQADIDNNDDVTLF